MAERIISTRDHILDELYQRKFLTPDYKDLEKYHQHLVFVDGMLKEGIGKNTFFLNEATYLGSAYTVETNYIMKRMAAFPITFQYNKKQPNPCKGVWGDLYAVDTDTMVVLDNLFANHVMYEREKKFIVCNEQFVDFKQGKKCATVEAWYYLGIEEYWEHQPLWFAAYKRHQPRPKDFVWDWNPDNTIRMNPSH